MFTFKQLESGYSNPLIDYQNLNSDSHTYNPNSIKWHLVMEPLKVVVPPLMCHFIGEIRICCQTGPHLEGWMENL